MYLPRWSLIVFIICKGIDLCISVITPLDCKLKETVNSCPGHLSFLEEYYFSFYLPNSIHHLLYMYNYVEASYIPGCKLNIK